MRIIFILSYCGFLLLNGCNAEPYVPSLEACFRIANVSPLEHFKIKEIDTIDVGEFKMVTTLIVPEDYYRIIESEIRGKPFFVEYDSNTIPLSALEIGTKLSKSYEIAYHYKEIIVFEHFDPNSWSVTRLRLKDDSLIFVDYIEF